MTTSDVHTAVEKALQQAAILLQRDQASKAAQLLYECTEKWPDAGAAWQMLGSALVQMQRFEAARDALQTADRLIPGQARTLFELGYACFRMRDVDAAVGYYRRVVERGNPAPLVLHQLGIAYRAMGDLKLARRQFRKALDGRPGGALFYDLARITRYPPNDPSGQELIDEIGNWLNQSSPHPSDAALAHFALGKLHEDADRHGEAFDHFALANRAQHKAAAITLEMLEADMDAIGQAFDHDLFASGRRGHESRMPVFVMGAIRSGTSLVEQIITSHPLAAGIGEQALLSHIAANSGKSIEAIARSCSTSELQGMAQSYLDGATRLAGRPSATRIVDKMPDNAFLMGMAHLLFPNAAIVNVRRHPLDTGLSIYSQSFQYNRTYYCDLEEIGVFLRRYLELNRRLKTRVDGDVVLDVFYESLVDNQETISRKLITHCGLAWDDKCLDFDQNRNIMVTASTWQVRQPLYGTAKGKWTHYRRQLEPLIEALGDEVARFEQDLAESRR